MHSRRGLRNVRRREAKESRPAVTATPEGENVRWSAANLSPAAPSLLPPAAPSVSEMKMRQLAESMRQYQVDPQQRSAGDNRVGRDASAARDANKLLDSQAVEEVEVVTADNQHDILKKSITPLHYLRYSEQLKEKDKLATSVLLRLNARLEGVNEGVEGGDHAPRTGLPCPLQPIVPSPEITHCRNKDEFVVGRGVSGGSKTVGFLTGPPRLPSSFCVPPTHLPHIREAHKLFAKHFAAHIASSPLPTCLHFTSQPGVWRSVSVRSNQQGELMACVTIHPHTLSEWDLTELKEGLVEYFTRGDGSELNLSSLYLQVCPHSRCSRSQAPLQLLYGQEFLHDSCQGLDFALAPDSFFPPNTACTEKLLQTIIEVGELTPHTTVLDVACGNGATCLSLSGHVRGCVGVGEEEAVMEAKANAKANGVQNVHFIAGPAHEIVTALTADLAGCTDVLAVVNAARGGIKPNLVQSLRSNPAITRLLFLTSRPLGYPLSNMVSLGSLASKKLKKHPPLIPSYAFTVDMYPHTPHVEMGVLFRRVHNH